MIYFLPSFGKLIGFEGMLVLWGAPSAGLKDYLFCASGGHTQGNMLLCELMKR
jgi:hypothetical protein